MVRRNKDCFGIVYKVTDLLNNKVYIGQTVEDIGSRKWEHESRARRGKGDTYFNRAMIKHSFENFTWYVLEKCDNKEEMDEMEFHYIKQYNAYGDGGYNLTFGGEGSHGYKHSQEVCKFISEMKTGIKMSEKSIRIRSEKQSLDWEITYPNGEVEQVRNLNEFCRLNALAPAGMSRVAYGKRKSHKGFKCRRLSPKKFSHSNTAKGLMSVVHKGRKLTDEQRRVSKKASCKQWVVVNPDGGQISVFNLKEFCNSNGLSYGCMLRVSRGERGHHHGYKCVNMGYEYNK